MILVVVIIAAYAEALATWLQSIARIRKSNVMLFCKIAAQWLPAPLLAFIAPWLLIQYPLPLDHIAQASNLAWIQETLQMDVRKQ